MRLAGLWQGQARQYRGLHAARIELDVAGPRAAGVRVATGTGLRSTAGADSGASSGKNQDSLSIRPSIDRGLAAQSGQRSRFGKDLIVTSALETALPPVDDTDFVRFWNEVLAPKFIR